MPVVVVRSLLARVGTAVVLVCAFLVVLVVVRADGLLEGLRAASWCALVTDLVWLLWWAPQLVLDADGLTVRNAWRTHTLPWESIASVRTRWGLEVVTDTDRVVKASAAPRSGGLTAAFRERRRLQHKRDGVADPAGDKRAVRDEYVTPGEGLHRATMTADSAADLIEVYGRVALEQRDLAERRRIRAERIAAGRRRRGTRGAGHAAGSSGDACPEAAASDDGPGAASGAGATGPADAPDGPDGLDRTSPVQDSGVTSRTNTGVAAAAVVVLLAVVATTLM